jgi:aryl-alcohol dehydrogenase-like predicted oxidoreductase
MMIKRKLVTRRSRHMRSSSGKGKVRVIGASNFTVARLEDSLRSSAAHGYARYESLQPEYNLYSREGFEKGSRSVRFPTSRWPAVF